MARDQPLVCSFSQAFCFKGDSSEQCRQDSGAFQNLATGTSSSASYGLEIGEEARHEKWVGTRWKRDHGGHAEPDSTESPGDPQIESRPGCHPERFLLESGNLEKCGLLRLGSFLGGGGESTSMNLTGDITRGHHCHQDQKLIFGRSEFPNKDHTQVPGVRAQVLTTRLPRTSAFFTASPSSSPGPCPASPVFPPPLALPFSAPELDSSFSAPFRRPAALFLQGAAL